MPYQWNLRPYRRRFKQPLQTSHGVWTMREGIILRLVDDAGRMGWGEIAPIPWFGSETMAQALAFCHQLPAVLTDDLIFAIPDALPACQFGFESAWEEVKAGAIDGIELQRRGDAEHLVSVVTRNVTLPPPNTIVAVQNTIVAVPNAIVAVQNTIVAPQNSDVAPQSSTLRPQNSDIAVQNSIVPPPNSDIAALNSELRPQNSDITALNSELRPQNSNDKAQNSILQTQSSTLQHQNAELPLLHPTLHTPHPTPHPPIPPSPHSPHPTPHSPLPTPPSLPLSALLPAGNAALHTWKPLWAESFRTFKWKIGVSAIATELEIFHCLTQALPPTAKLRLDANGGLSFDDATQWLQSCDALADPPTRSVTIEYLEQPLPVAQFAAMQSLSQRYKTPIALDESVATLQQLQTCYASGWRGIFVIKPAIVGSPSRLRQFCQSHAIDAVFSSAFETAIGRQAGLQLAAALGNRDRAVGYGTTHWFAKH